MSPCSTDSCFFKYRNYVLFMEDKKNGMSMAELQRF